MSIEKKFKYCVFFVAVVAGWVLSDMFLWPALGI